MLDKIASKIVHKRERRQSIEEKEVKHFVKQRLVDSISKNPQCFLESPAQKEEVLPSHQLQDYAYE